ncbi:MAG TPA: hypothetical protein VFT22_07905 [Kofleriaceae bacterium]|nr:hypothetical protein [Kofleriaceae bacterium]
MATSRPALLLAALLLAACSSTAVAGPAGSRAPNSNAKGPAQMASNEQDIAVAQRAIAHDLQIPESAVKVRALAVTVPGILVFTAAVDPGKAGRHVTRTGIVEGGAVYTETEAMSRVARAWKYGARRTVPPVTVAQVFGALHSATAESSAFIDEDTVQTYKKVSGPRRASTVALPTEATVDGHPAVVYCLTSSARSIPFSVVTAIVKPDFQVELRAQPVLED